MASPLSRARSVPIPPAIDSEWVSRRDPELGVYRVLEIRPARRAVRHNFMVGPDAICSRQGRIVVVPVRSLQGDGPFVPHMRAEAA